MQDTWYGDGLRFECTRCGDCCTGAPGYVWVNREEAARLARLLGLSTAEFFRRYLRRVGRRTSLIERPGGDCVFYDRGCTVYQARPEQCRTFPFWPENLRSRADWESMGRECPGIDRGRLYSPTDIQLIRRGEGEAAAP